MANKYNFYFTEIANLDIADTIDYLNMRLNNSQAADNFIIGIEKTIDNITTFPNSGALSEIKTLKELGIRKAFIGNYIMFYETNHNAQTITILRLRYGKSDLSQF